MSWASVGSNSGIMHEDNNDKLPFFPVPVLPLRVTTTLRQRGIETQDTTVVATNLGALLAPEDAEDYHETTSEEESLATDTLSKVTDADYSDDDGDMDNSKLDNGAPDTWMSTNSGNVVPNGNERMI